MNAIGEPGIALDREPDRLYPETTLASHVLGFTNIDGKGSERDRTGVPFLSIRSQDEGPTACSFDLQPSAAGARGRTRRCNAAFLAIGAAGVVMDVHTGEVIAMTSLPSFNPNAPGQATPDQLFNRATLGVFELGSTFKPFTLAMAMDSGTVSGPGQMMNCPEVLPAYGHLVHDTHPFGRRCSVAEIMMESSNIGMAQIADQLGTERQKAWLKKMGFLDRVEIELKERGRPLTPGKRWGPFETMTVGFGEGIAVAPLQLAMGYATLFDGGIYHTPTILKVSPEHPLAQGRRVFTADTSYRMRSLLRLVVMKGTGRKADAPGYRHWR